MWKDLSCLSATVNIILCGLKVHGEDQIIVLLTPWLIHRWDPSTRLNTVLEQDPKIGKGAGHHSVIQIPGRDEWYIVYHRRPLDRTGANERVTCIDRMYFDENGYIKPVKITFEGVPERKLP